jgi:hypothetical protein
MSALDLDPKILAEAQTILQSYTLAAQELIKQNLYGPREARFAGAIVKNAFTVVSYESPTETEVMQEFRGQVSDHVSRLVELLERATAIIEESVGDQQELLTECGDLIATAEEDFIEVEDDRVPGTGGEDVRKIFVVVFPPLDEAVMAAEAHVIEQFVNKLQSYNLPVWTANEADFTKRLKAMTMREIYNVGRVSAVVLTDSTGTVLDGWYNGLPWIDEALARIRSLR